MITQDSLRFYKNHAVYPQFGGVVLDREEGKRIASHLGDGKAIILQNHGLITVGQRMNQWSSQMLTINTGGTNNRRRGILISLS